MRATTHVVGIPVVICFSFAKIVTIISDHSSNEIGVVGFTIMVIHIHDTKYDARWSSLLLLLSLL